MYYWMNSETIHALLTNLWGSINVLLCKYSCHGGTLSTQRLQPYTVVKLGSGIDPATEVTLKLPLFVFRYYSRQLIIVILNPSDNR